MTEDLGYEDISATSKEEFLNHQEHFLSSEHFDKSIIFEVFIDDYHDEEKAWELLTSTEARII